MSDILRRITTDVGGTFTDLVCFDINGATGETTIRTAKSDTTPLNFEQGVLNVMAKAGVDPASIDFLAHGTTMVINALTERKGVKVGLLTTKGFRDTLEIARGNRPDFFNLAYEKPEPFGRLSDDTCHCRSGGSGRSHRGPSGCARWRC